MSHFKQRLIFALSLCYSLCVSADPGNQWFVGGEWGKGKNDYHMEASFSIQGKETGNLSHKHETDTQIYGVKFGKYLNNSFRAYGSYLRNSPKDKQVRKNEDYFLGSADYLLLPGYPVRPFVGVTAGAVKTEYFSESKAGFAYGMQGGVLYQYQKLDLELGLRYLTNNMKKESITTLETPLGGGTVRFYNKDIKQFYLSASYRF